MHSKQLIRILQNTLEYVIVFSVAIFVILIFACPLTWIIILCTGTGKLSIGCVEKK